MKNAITTTLTLEDKSFINEKGETVNYIDASVIIDGEKLPVKFRKEDRGLLRVLRRSFKEVK